MTNVNFQRYLFCFLVSSIITFSAPTLGAPSSGVESKAYDALNCEGRKSRTRVAFSSYGKYFVCIGKDAKVRILSIAENPGKLLTLKLPVEVDRSDNISDVEVTKDERHSVIEIIKSVDGFKTSSMRLFVANNETGLVTSLVNNVPDSCTVESNGLSSDGRYLVYSISGLGTRTDYNTMKITAYGCDLKYSGYYVFDFKTMSSKLLHKFKTDSAMGFIPYFSPDSKHVLIAGDHTSELIVANLTGQRKLVDIGNELRNASAGYERNFYALGFAGNRHVYGKMKKSSDAPEIDSGYDAEILTVVPINGEPIILVSTGLMPEGVHKVKHIIPVASPDGRRIFYTQRDGLEADAMIYAVPTEGGDPQLVYKSKRLGVGSLIVTPDNEGIVYESRDKLHYSNFDGSDSISYSRYVDLLEEQEELVDGEVKLTKTKVQRKFKVPGGDLIRFNRGRIYFIGENVSRHCGEGWLGIYSAPVEGGETKYVMPHSTKNCYVYDFTFSRDGKTMYYVSSKERSRDFVFHSVNTEKYEEQTEIMTVGN